MRFRSGISVRLAAVAVVAAWGALLSGQARAYEFVDLATYTTSTTQTVGHACVLYNGTDMSCASTNPYVTSAGLVGIGTSNPTAALEVSGTVSATAFVGSGAGLTNVVAVPGGTTTQMQYNNEGTLAGAAVYYVSATNRIGIGTNNPSKTLHILSSSNNTVARFSGTGTTWKGIELQNSYASSSSYGGVFIDVLNEASAAIGNMYADINTDGSSAWVWSTQSAGARTDRRVERMRIASTGNVGIGTSQPKALLDISGTLRLADGGEACDAGRAGAIKYSGGVFSFCAGSYWQSLAAAAGGGGASQADRIVSTSANVVVGNGGTISFTTGGVSGTAYIDTAGRFVAAGVSTTGGISGTTGYFSGNVGVGTSAPQGKLTIHNTVTAAGSVNDGSLFIDQDYTGAVPSQLTIRGSGNANQQLMFGYNTTGDYAAINAFKQAAGNVPLILQNAGGNVGIGTTGPQTPLDVSGAIKISGDGTEGCTTTADEGKIRRNPVTGHFQLCAH